MTIGKVVRQSWRTGFTLIELLVVMLVIGILITLSAAATLRFIDVQKESNTKTALLKVGTAVNSQWKNVKDRAFKESIPNRYAPAYGKILGFALGDPARARVIWTKARLQEAFPQSFSEAVSPAPALGFSTGLPAYSLYMQNLGINAAVIAAMPPDVQSAACLLMILQRGESNRATTSEDLGGVASAMWTSGPVSVPYMVDGWGKPLILCRWPAFIPLLNPSPTGIQGFKDPLDPQGYLANKNWVGTMGSGTFQQTIHSLPQGNNGGPNPGFSFYLVPVVISSGQDKLLGYTAAYPFMGASDATTASADNLFSVQQ